VGERGRGVSNLICAGRGESETMGLDWTDEIEFLSS
jgi:hypothetical protein